MYYFDYLLCCGFSSNSSNNVQKHIRSTLQLQRTTLKLLYPVSYWKKLPANSVSKFTTLHLMTFIIKCILEIKNLSILWLLAIIASYYNTYISLVFSFYRQSVCALTSPFLPNQPFRCFAFPHTTIISHSSIAIAVF